VVVRAAAVPRPGVLRAVGMQEAQAVRARRRAVVSTKWTTIFRSRPDFVVFLLVKARLPKARGPFSLPTLCFVFKLSHD